MISVFFSSTFRDMQQERNLIQKYVFPEVEMYAKQRGEILNIVDLRWGIDTSSMNDQVAMSKIMAICEEKIHDSFPCFITLLGENYGSEVNKREYPCDGLTAGKTIGITEYEIVTRLGMGAEEMSFFARNDVQEIQPRAKELRQHISERFPNQFHYYELKDHQAIQKFIEQIVRTICQYIDKAVRSKPFSLQYMHYVISRSTILIGRQGYHERINEIFRSGNPFVLLTGLNGIGKKSILYSYIVNRPGLVIGMHTSINTVTTDLEYICEQLLEQLCFLLENDVSAAEQNKSSVSRLKEALQTYDETVEDDLYIVIEDIEKLLGPNWTNDMLCLPICNWRHIHWCGTAAFLRKHDEITADLVNIFEIPIDYLDKTEKKQMVTMIFSAQHKQLGEETTNMLCSKRFSSYPFYLYALMRSMLLLDDIDLRELSKSTDDEKNAGDKIEAALTAYVRSVPDDPKAMLQFVFRQIRKKTNQILLDQILSLICHTRFGLREKDLKVVLVNKLQISELDFYYVFHYIQFLLNTDCFNRYTLFPDITPMKFSKSELIEVLIDYLETLPTDDIIKCNELPLLYASTHRPYECLCALWEHRDWTREMQTVLLTILNEYWDSFYTAFSKLDFSDKNILEHIAQLLFFLSEIKYPAKDENQIIRLMEIISAKCSNLEDNPVRYAYQYSIMSCLSIIADRLDLKQQSNALKKKTQEYFEKMHMIRLPESTSFMDDIFETVSTHLRIMELIGKARKCLDHNLPDTLFKFIIKSIDELFGSLYSELEENFREKILAMLGVIHSLSLYYELIGDFLIKKGNKEEALEHYQYAETCETGRYSTNHATFLVKLGKIYEDEQMLDKALNCYRKAYSEYRQTIDLLQASKNEAAIPLSICRMANIHLKWGEYEKTYKYLNNACTMFEIIFKETKSIQSAGDYATCLFKIGELAIEANQWQLEGRSAAIKAAYIMRQIAYKTQSPDWEKNYLICLNILDRLGGIPE